MASTSTELVSDILEDALRLAHQQLAMLKAEIREDLDRAKRAAGFGSVGIVMLTVGGLTLVAFLVNLLHEQFGLSMWSSCLIIGGALSASGFSLAVAAWNLFDNFNPIPDKTITTIQENLTWNSQPQV